MSLEQRAVGSVADHQDLPVGPRCAVAGNRVEQVNVALPVAQGRDDTERGTIRQPEPGARQARIARHIAGEVDAGRDRGHPLGRNPVFARKLALDRFARRHDMCVRVHVEPARADPVVDRRGYVPRAHDGRPIADRGAGDRTEPAVRGAVRVEDIDIGAMRQEPLPQCPQIGQAFFAQRQRDHRNAHALRRCHDRSLRRGKEGDAVTAVKKPARFSEDADLLTAPAAGILRMDNR